jgi:translation initiation factor IF-3
LKEKVRINHQIRAAELRVIGPDGANLGILSLGDALRKAEEVSLDLIEISPNAVPPIGKIMDYGKFQYQENKKAKESKAKVHTTETKSIQVKVETGEHDMSLKAKKTSEWLTEGHRVRVDLFLRGRYKYMPFEFLKERLERFLLVIPGEYKLAEPVAKGPKGLTTVLERVKK